jgi:hypothetical protein
MMEVKQSPQEMMSHLLAEMKADINAKAVALQEEADAKAAGSLMEFKEHIKNHVEALLVILRLTA